MSCCKFSSFFFTKISCPSPCPSIRPSVHSIQFNSSNRQQEFTFTKEVEKTLKIRIKLNSNKTRLKKREANKNSVDIHSFVR